MSRKPRRRHIKNYLLNRQLQFRYVGFAVITSMLLTAVLGTLLWRLRGDATTENISASKAIGVEISEFIARSQSGDDNLYIMVLFGVGVGLALLISLYMIVLTHRLAGPLFVMGRRFDQISDGELPALYPLRKGDQLQGPYSELKLAVEFFRTERQQDLRLAERAQTMAESLSLGDLQKAVTEWKKPRQDGMA